MPGRHVEIIERFGKYGFPEPTFAPLIDLTCWLRRHEPAVFLAAMLTSQPLGIYAPVQLVRNARERRIRILPVDVVINGWESVLEGSTAAPPGITNGVDYRQRPAVRFGLNRIRGLTRAGSLRIVAVLGGNPLASRIVDHTPMLGQRSTHSRDFR